MLSCTQMQSVSCGCFPDCPVSKVLNTSTRRFPLLLLAQRLETSHITDSGWKQGHTGLPDSKSVMASAGSDDPPASAAPPKRRFIGRSPATASATAVGPSPKASTSAQVPLNAVPPEILQDPLINASINALLPRNYSFEIHKTIHQIRKFQVKRVALQMPEGLAMFGTGISDLIEMHTDAE